MTAEQIDDLFAQTLTGNYDEETPWAAVNKLQKLASREVVELAREWCVSNEPLKRARGADVLSQIGVSVEHPQNSFPAESFSAVLELSRHETESLPLRAAISALGHIGNPLAIPALIQNCPHNDDGVRLAVALALGKFANDPRATRALIVLMQDGDEVVRDWATFGLGVLGKTDSPEIRDALLQQIADADTNTREEAFVALAKRKEARAVPALISVLKQGPLSDRLRESAELFLGEQSEEWDEHDFAKALKQRYTLT
jgi:HEAT repeat protein